MAIVVIVVMMMMMMMMMMMIRRFFDSATDANNYEQKKFGTCSDDVVPNYFRPLPPTSEV